MAMESRYPKGEIVLAHWKVEKHLGSGSNGKTAVFVLSHANFGEIRSALKVVNLITEEGRLEECTPFQKNEYLSARESCTKAATQEVLLMSGLQGQPNIVGYLDHTIVDWQEDGFFGRDLLIRMELLTDLRQLMLQGKIFTEAEVIRIGTDICAALAVCHQKNILHRDIKPENIFVNEDGVYKLGDFGISRILDSAPDSRASTGVGTPQYAAPEQFSQGYDKRADLYSLGLVLYELRNGNRLPFTDAQSAMPEYVRRRLSGEALPELKSTSPELASAIFRACRFRPEERFRSAEEFSAALMRHAAADTHAESHRSLPKKAAGKRYNSDEIQKLLLLGITAVLAVVLAFAVGARREPAQVPPTEPAMLQTAPAESEQSAPAESALSQPAPTQSQTVPTEETPTNVDSPYTYDLLDDGTLSITGRKGDKMPRLLVLPGEIDGKPVTVIGENAFCDTDIQGVVISEGVTRIGHGAFAECSELETVTLPKSLKTIENAAFQLCRALWDIQLPEGLYSIGHSAFNCSGITRLSIPASLQRLDDTFLACRELKRIDVAEDSPYFSSENGVLFDKEKTTLLRFPSNHQDRVYSVPESVKTLAVDAFEGAKLKALELPESLQVMEERSIYYLGDLGRLTIPASVRYIAEGAISGCYELESITVAQGNESYVGSDGVLYTADMTMLVAFPPARTGAFTIPDTVTELGEEAFSRSKLSQVVIPESVKNIPKDCFEFCSNLQSISLPEGLTEIGLAAFDYCRSLSEVKLPLSLRFIDRYAFRDCEVLKSVIIPNHNCIVEEEAFPESCRVIR